MIKSTENDHVTVMMLSCVCALVSGSRLSVLCLTHISFHGSMGATYGLPFRCGRSMLLFYMMLWLEKSSWDVR